MILLYLLKHVQCADMVAIYFTEILFCFKCLDAIQLAQFFPFLFFLMKLMVHPIHFVVNLSIN